MTEFLIIGTSQYLEKLDNISILCLKGVNESNTGWTFFYLCYTETVECATI